MRTEPFQELKVMVLRAPSTKRSALATLFVSELNGVPELFEVGRSSKSSQPSSPRIGTYTYTRLFELSIIKCKHL